MGFRFQGLGFRVQGLGWRVQVLGFRVQGLGFRVQGLGFRVQGLGFRVHLQHGGGKVYVNQCQRIEQRVHMPSMPAALDSPLTSARAKGSGFEVSG